MHKTVGEFPGSSVEQPGLTVSLIGLPLAGLVGCSAACRRHSPTSALTHDWYCQRIAQGAPAGSSVDQGGAQRVNQTGQQGFESSKLLLAEVAVTLKRQLAYLFACISHGVAGVVTGCAFPQG
jgi:hypothetical protein